MQDGGAMEEKEGQKKKVGGEKEKTDEGHCDLWGGGGGGSAF